MTNHVDHSCSSQPETPPVLVAALYRFTPLADHPSLQQPLFDRMQRDAIFGTLLLAGEGINGTIAGEPTELRAFVDWLRNLEHDDHFPFAATDVKWSECAQIPFRRARVRLKKEIVTMGVDGIDPLESVGTYVDPEDWNSLVDDPSVIVIDTRNDYEVEIGTFAGAVNPNTDTFREFPRYVAENLDPEQHPKVAMFCTGGIRCEKSTAYLKECGFTEVYHLRGGILNYLERVSPEQSRWQGECFVFDSRVSVDHHLQAGEHSLCHGCGWPVTREMKADDRYEHGVACPRCAADITEEQRRRRRERQRQIDLQQSDRQPNSMLAPCSTPPSQTTR
ncbi:oxygen-dependent tRNA uridine(34) hydroxylase TrhO [Allorhodopirellula solitaria]|uniref:tRNA uridine(34) hydroxylase n=1 Tax=Allorhodopirellula solitaria TaxID=2527987 RepID=A0A5C5YI10_9BACT|nr:rhodanese-related sulfurtransferase [Allorhodopirellula solitaria]TWT73942.1 putative rhodanese-related sulfurtransferase [Allorhodopirellula solitaria]